jgi:Arc/MetJ family transcription regulator
MRTTINIDDELLVQAKIAAARGHKPLGAVVDDALRAMLGRDTELPDQSAAMVLETDGGSGLQPGVDLEDKDSLAELLGDNAMSGAAG